mmetsp:Transcript_41899/g.135615  ORF Transcript_41899/g.135615 Transcript_41899/m.135615 type:complete len:236 (+) Transcript_41899:401-1108(+)
MLITLQPSVVAKNHVVILSRLGECAINDQGERKLQQWRVSKTLSYCFQSMGYDLDVVECVSKLVVARAFPRGPPYVLRDSDGVEHFRSSLERLESCGFVGMLYEQGGCSEWQLTEAGMNDLIPALTIDEPTPALQVRPNIALEDKTSHELLRALEANGWVWQRRLKGHECPPHDGGSAKLFYTSGLALCTKYAQCLLSAPRLAKLGVLAIEHCKLPTYYSKVLRGNPPDPAALPG